MKLAEHSIIDDVRNLEVDLQNKERNLEDYWNEAKQILYRIKSLENEHQEVCLSLLKSNNWNILLTSRNYRFNVDKKLISMWIIKMIITDKFLFCIRR